ASGSLLGIALRNTASIPVGSIIRKQMYQLDFEEWLMAEGWGKEALDYVRDCYKRQVSLTEAQHENLIGEFKKYLLVGGMPDAVNTYIDTHNIVRVREVQESIRNLYKEDAAKHEKESSKKLLIRRIYDMIVSQMENKKKRIVAKDIRDKKATGSSGMPKSLNTSYHQASPSMRTPFPTPNTLCQNQFARTC
ncbi:MAG: ATP-binding protein, partial [Paludibacteraceae bacterium]|nr:ATP-binding protein [Paludibacteraceae bacterium]